MNSTPADEHRYLELVNENRNKILRICRVYAWNAADQEDLYQEILFQIWRGLPALKEGRFVHTWLYRVAINTGISFLRKHSRGVQRLVQFEPGALARAIEARQDAEQDSAERLDQLYASIYRLDPLERALVVLFLEDLSYEQIAEASGISPNHVGVILHHAKKKLSELMTEKERVST